jgi:hypothetical protein
LDLSRLVSFAGTPSPHPAGTVKWKTTEETYRRLLELLEE